LFGSPIVWQSGLFRCLRNVRPDIVVLEANPRIVSSYVLLFALRLTGKRVVIWGLGQVPLPEGRSRCNLFHLPYLVLARSSHAAIGYGDDAARFYTDIGSPLVFVAPNAVEDVPDWYNVCQKSPDKIALQAHGLSSSTFTILVLGRLIPEKRIDVLFLSIPIRTRLVQVIVIGDGPERPMLEQLAAARGIAAHFFGMLIGPALHGRLRSADLLVMPGSGGLAIQQAMAWGVPAVVGCADGTEGDLIRDGESGVVVVQDTPEGWWAAISGLLSNDELLTRMSRNAWQQASASGGMTTMVERYATALSAVLLP
jgi:glycosyltransferase involved in cell wall biosynthesis